MKSGIIVAIVLAGAAVIVAMRQGFDLGPIVQALPFCGGGRPVLYEVAGCALLGITGWGLLRLKKHEP